MNTKTNDILVVEDERDIRDALKEILELAGYNVFEAPNGKEAFEMIIKSPPDLILSDVNMPKMDGFELLGAVNQHLDGPIPPFLFLTARADVQDIRSGLSMGADDYILKPFDHKEVLAMVEMRLAKRKQIVQSAKESTNVISSAFNKLALPSEEGLELIEYKDILRCEADRAYCRFYTKSGKRIVVSKPLKVFEPLLLARHFLRVHKSAIVNIAEITKYVKGKGGTVILSDGSEVDVSVRRVPSLMKVLRPSY